VSYRVLTAAAPLCGDKTFLTSGAYFGSRSIIAPEWREATAKAICARCPVRDSCLAYALDTRQEFGIWGGLNEDERRAILRRQRSAS